MKQTQLKSIKEFNDYSRSSNTKSIKLASTKVRRLEEVVVNPYKLSNVFSLPFPERSQRVQKDSAQVEDP